MRMTSIFGSGLLRGVDPGRQAQAERRYGREADAALGHAVQGAWNSSTW